MARLVVLPDSPNLREQVPPDAAYVEEVTPEHFDDEHTSIQILERVAWAINDATRKGVRLAPRRHGPR